MAATAKKSKIDLAPFCDPENTRYALDVPFVIAGWKYASDGRVCVRIPTKEQDTQAPEGKKLVKADQLFSKIGGVVFQPWPNAPIQRCNGTCVFCFGDGKYPYWKCPKCEGHGFIDTKECKKCDGEGTDGEKCFNCSGVGHGLFCCHQDVLGIDVSYRYLRLIEKLPGELTAAKYEEHSIAFQFEGGEGLIAGMAEH